MYYDFETNIKKEKKELKGLLYFGFSCLQVSNLKLLLTGGAKNNRMVTFYNFRSGELT